MTSIFESFFDVGAPQTTDTVVNRSRITECMIEWQWKEFKRDQRAIKSQDWRKVYNEDE